jgi:hypothetical protein
MYRLRHEQAPGMFVVVGDLVALPALVLGGFAVSATVVGGRRSPHHRRDHMGNRGIYQRRAHRDRLTLAGRPSAFGRRASAALDCALLLLDAAVAQCAALTPGAFR